MSKRSTAGLVKYVKFLVDAGAMKPPLWLKALERVPPPEVPKQGRRPPTITFPEDELLRIYYKRHPEASLEPLDLASFEPPPARRFVARQMQLIAEGLSHREAYAKVEREVAAAAAKAPPATTVVEVVQSEEEAHLQQALATYTQRHGHLPPIREPPPSAAFGPHRGPPTVHHHQRQKQVPQARPQPLQPPQPQSPPQQAQRPPPPQQQQPLPPRPPQQERKANPKEANAAAAGTSTAPSSATEGAP